MFWRASKKSSTQSNGFIYFKILQIIILKTQRSSLAFILYFINLGSSITTCIFTILHSPFFKLLLNNAHINYKCSTFVDFNKKYQMIGASNIYGAVTPNYYPWNSFLFWYSICWWIMFFPFLIADLIFAYRDTSCAQVPTTAGNIDLTLRTWLQVDGYIILGFGIMFLLIGIFAMPYPEWQCLYVLWENLHVIFILWRLSWLIIGAIMFWADLNKSGLCHYKISRYMWANLIIGFVWLFVELVLAFAYVKPIPQPVPVPVTSTPTGPVVAPLAIGTSTVLRPRIY